MFPPLPEKDAAPADMTTAWRSAFGFAQSGPGFAAMDQSWLTT